MVPPKKQNGETQTLLSICENSFTWSTALLSILGIFICSACSHVCATVNAATTFAVIQSHIQDLETTYPDSFNLMASDFNHMLRKTLPKYQHQVMCATRWSTYFISKWRMCILLGLSDHDLVSLVPWYLPLVQHVPPIRKSVRKSCVNSLQDCFEATDWNMFVDTLSDITKLADCITISISVRMQLGKRKPSELIPTISPE